MRGTTILSITARQVYSDRMKAAVQVTVKTENGAEVMAVSSVGLSVGSYENSFVYDRDDRFEGLGVDTAVRHVNQIIAPALKGMDAANQTACDGAILSLGKEMLGGNAVSSVSSGILHAGAAALGIPLYQHIGGARAVTLPVPGATAATGSTRYGGPVSVGYKPAYSFVAYGFDTFTEAVAGLWEVFMDWSDYIKDKLGIRMQPIAGMAIPRGKLRDDFLLWEMMGESIARSGYQGRVGLQADIAANSFYNKETGMYEGLFSAEPKNREEMIRLVTRMAKEHPFVIIEDPLHQDDFEGFGEITRRTDIQIVGDDLIATNPVRLKKAIDTSACNAVRIVTAQIGTVTEAAEVVQMATENNIGVSPCGERGEGVAICDYAVGYNAGTARENGMGYSGNRLLQIERELGRRARFFGGAGIRGERFRLGKTPVKQGGSYEDSQC